MRNICLIILFFSTSILLHAQEFYVLQVKGNVKNTRTGKPLKTSDVIKADDKIVFSAATDAVAVVSPKSGRFILKPGESKPGSEFVAIVKNILTPGSNRLSTRNGGFNNAFDFQNYFSESVVLLPALRYQVSRESFPMGTESFFFIRYRHGGEDINKKLTHEGDTLVITKNELFTVDGKSVSPENTSNLHLFYFREKKATQVSPLSLVVVDADQLRTEISVIKDAMSGSGNTDEKIRDEMLSYIQDIYGKADILNFTRWYK